MAITRGLAASMAFLLTLALVGPAFGQSQEIQELLRKGKASEKESGFCATTSWPVRTDLKVFEAFLDNTKPGATYVARTRFGGNSSGCSYYRLTSAYLKGNDTCVVIEGAFCFVGEDCGPSKREWCKKNGTWTFTKD